MAGGSWLGLLAFTSLLFIAPAKAGVWDPACVNGLPKGRPCVDIGNSFAAFRSQIENAADGDFIVFCPFDIQHDGVRINPGARTGFACDPSGPCVINGPGQAFSISEADSETMFYGFTFVGMDDGVVFVRDTAKKEHLFCKCVFEGNTHSSRGGVLRTSANTIVTVRSCMFKGNYAGRGGAVYNRGNMTILDSQFKENSANEGACVALASYSRLTLEGNTFDDNSATVSGPVVWGEFSTTDLAAEYDDGGWNIATNNGGCEGLYNNGDCIEFEFSGTLAPTISTSPTISPSTVPSAVPSEVPSVSPTASPSRAPTTSPAPSDSEPSASPAPSASPTSSPTTAPSDLPSASPTTTPSKSPTESPAPTGSQPTLSPAPSFHPTVSHQPSVSPTALPSMYPTDYPSDVPSTSPSQRPSSSPSSSPTMAPTPTYTPPPDPDEEFLPLVDRNQPGDYFNFNKADPDFGPDHWENIDISNSEWKRYEKEEEGFSVSRNECGRGGIQSPIDLSRTNAACEEFHQVRARGGDWRNMTQSGNIVFQVTPRNLRLQIEGDSLKGPRADSPGGFTELYMNHLEVHVPSLHTFDGKRYDAEYSLYHIQGSKDRVLALSVLVDASVDKYNHQFQKMLNAWGQVQDCGIEGGRRLSEMDILAEHEEDNEFIPEDGDEEGRRLVQIGGKHNVYHVDLVPSIHWFAYTGSLVQPPCTRNAHWRVYDTPMEIGVSQLKQLRSILRDGPCRDDPYRVGLGDSMARPTETDRGRDIWRCTEENFLSDCERFGFLCPAPGFPGN